MVDGVIEVAAPARGVEFVAERELEAYDVVLNVQIGGVEAADVIERGRAKIEGVRGGAAIGDGATVKCREVEGVAGAGGDHCIRVEQQIDYARGAGILRVAVDFDHDFPIIQGTGYQAYAKIALGEGNAAARRYYRRKIGDADASGVDGGRKAEAKAEPDRAGAAGERVAREHFGRGATASIIEAGEQVGEVDLAIASLGVADREQVIAISEGVGVTRASTGEAIAGREDQILGGIGIGAVAIEVIEMQLAIAAAGADADAVIGLIAEAGLRHQ